MKDTVINAKLISFSKLRVTVFSSFPFDPKSFSLKEGGKNLKMVLEKQNSLSSILVADFHLAQDLPLGGDYSLLVPGYGLVPLDVDDAPTFPRFDDLYAYDGDDLGASYRKEGTSFALWAPLASRVTLKYRLPSSSAWSLLAMERGEKGVFRAEVKGDCEGMEYLFAIVNSGVSRIATDLYAKASTPNGASSVVLDFSKLKVDLHEDRLPNCPNRTDAIVYEGSVRDLTSDPRTDIEHKGRFLGLIERNRKNEAGDPVGFDYLLSLGFTHLQLLPFYDFKTVDEEHPKKSYNWGYDPAQFFVPEGSYASDVLDPSSRILDLKKMVAAFHENGIRIIMDVVYNHVYSFEDSAFQKTVPNYYFRQRRNGSFASTSGCGDDFASERKMGRKLILDCCAWWIDQYGVDGFRFDLMGILDVETLNAIEDLAKKRKPSFFLHGEGWNMGGEANLPLGTMDNYAAIPGYGFFNDFFRETVKRLYCQDFSCFQDAKAAYASSSLNFIRPARFLDARQSTNYIECHDNATYFDFVSRWHPDWDEGKKLRAVLGATCFVLLSFGVPFLHAGQEIGLSKKGLENTYNKGDEYNRFDYSLLPSRSWMVEKIRKFIEMRKRLNPLHAYCPSCIDKLLDVGEEGPCLRSSFLLREGKSERKIIVFFNPGETDYNIPDGGRKLLLCSEPCLDEKATPGNLVPAFSATVFEE